MDIRIGDWEIDLREDGMNGHWAFVHRQGTGWRSAVLSERACGAYKCRPAVFNTLMGWIKYGKTPKLRGGVPL